MKERWVNLFGWEGFYEISDAGSVRSLVRIGVTPIGERSYGGKSVNPILRNTGYLVVNLTKKGKRTQQLVHRLVLLSFKGEPDDGNKACHCNGIRTDNRLINLRWDTPKANSMDMVRHGKSCKGEKNGAAKATDEIVRGIRSSNLTIRSLSIKYLLSETTVSNIKHMRTWCHV